MPISKLNACVADLVRARCTTHGYFAGWKLLADLTPPSSNFPVQLVDDVLRCIAVYTDIRPVKDQRGPSTDLRMTITRDMVRDSIYHVGAKSLGGKEWMASSEYTERKWSNTQFAEMSPCASFAWLGAHRKTIAREDLDTCDALALLGTVDYDYDRNKTYARGFAHAMDLGRACIAGNDGRMRGVALASFLNLDVQIYVRQINEKWIAGGNDKANLGPRDISPADWLVALVGDCGSLGPFAYEPASVYTETKGPMFAALFLGHCFDLLYDRLTSNALSAAMYMEAQVTQYDVHIAFATTIMDRRARRAVESDELALFGDNSIFGMSVWAPFNGRYRTWERFVKYTRQLLRSKDPRAKNILEMAAQPRVLPDGDTVPVEELWVRATIPGVEKTLVPRVAIVHRPCPAPDMAHLMQPNLCDACTPQFQVALNAFETDELHSATELPSAAFASLVAARAAAIRRVAIFATEPSCCDVCASRIGCWADSVAYTVLTALMRSDESTSASEWLMQCYAAWSVTTWPMSVGTVLSGFDLICETTQEEGAMGQRDVVDC
ncbi:hypothetical protein FB45DRAFT_1059569 [Roridomyces roridus]|uniref:Uncharacterized protein n=1 Tax=Roridomyces roridus TaxID=1738132 RepID=A0AAD7BS50_9AGAR|nr:hypothetical protein FB45DRAFT_1059569 [Roridomyces roridus]